MLRTGKHTTIATALTAVLAFGLLSGLGSANAKPRDPFGGKFNHYQCYAIRDWPGKPLQTTLKLKDQFRGDAATTVKPGFLCNPVDKNGEGIPQPKVHLVRYLIKTRTPDKGIRHVKIGNQLEQNEYYVGAPQLLCVPSTKELMK